MSFENIIVKVFIFKFILSQYFELKEVLSKLGIIDLFEFGIVDLFGISLVESFYVFYVIYKVYIDVNERGIEVVVVLGVVMQKRFLDMFLEFYVNYFFLFIIYYKISSVILFMGRVKKFEMIEQENDIVKVNFNFVNWNDEF